MALGPNQTGSTLQSPVSSMMGYGNALLRQVDDETDQKRKKAMADASQQQPQPLLSNMFGY